MNTTANKKLKVKDMITVVLLALINVVIFFASSLLYATPVTIMLMPVFFSLLEGIVFFIIGTKVRKPGAMMVYAIVRGILGGYLPYVLLYFLSGIISELILRRSGYGSVKGLTISYIICQLCAALGSTIYPYAINLSKQAKKTKLFKPRHVKRTTLKKLAFRGYVCANFVSLCGYC